MKFHPAAPFGAVIRSGSPDPTDDTFNQALNFAAPVCEYANIGAIL